MKALIWPVVATSAVALFAASVLLVISGAGQHDLRVDMTRLQDHAFALGQKAAREKLKSGELVFLAAGHGWGMDTVPGFENDATGMCVIKNMHVKQYMDYGDAGAIETLKQKIQTLRSHPEETYYYGAGFNLVMTAEAMNKGVRTCF